MVQNKNIISIFRADIKIINKKNVLVSIKSLQDIYPFTFVLKFTNYLN